MRNFASAIRRIYFLFPTHRTDLETCHPKPGPPLIDGIRVSSHDIAHDLFWPPSPQYSQLSKETGESVPQKPLYLALVCGAIDFF